nr:uncharacterized protein LOC111428132 [Onthophagus taurus]XP_022919309.1 uncharacterized protein LOC111428132 [Onthophagus taurus]
MSSRAFGRGRCKKRVSTTLGKAPSLNNRDSETDLSTIRKPINTSIFGLRQVLSLFETATEEVKRYIAYECDIIYECRTCRSLFRSLANFILHKRSYCQETFEAVYQSKDAEDVEGVYEINDGSDEKAPKKKISDVLKKLNEIHENLKSSEEITLNELTEDKEINDETISNNNKKICLEKIENSTAGVFQTISNETIGNELIKSQVMEIHSMLNTNEAILQPDGKAFKFQKSNLASKHKLLCSICNATFSTKKTLRYHVKYKHNDTKLVFSCPECKETFANAWGVFRHLYKIHRKTTAQIRKLRDQIHSNPIVKPQGNDSKEKDKESSVANSDNQWLENLEGDSDIQICGGCGKRFERKAALHSHSQICLKRIAVVSSSKKSPEEKTMKKFQTVIKGSKKRKQKISVKFIKDQQPNGTTKDATNDVPIIDLNSDDDEINVFFADDLEMENLEKEIINEENENAKVEDVLKEKDQDEEETVQNQTSENDYEHLEIDLIINGVNLNQPEVIVDLTEDIDENNENNLKNTSNASASTSTTSPLIADTSSENDVNSNTNSNIKALQKVPGKKRKRPLETSLKAKSDQYVNWDLLKCTPCTATFTTNDSLLEHMAMHFNWFRFQCKMCTFVSYNSKACSNHLQSEHKLDPDDIESCVIPMSNTKAIKLSSDFKAFSSEMVQTGEKSPEVDKVDKGDPDVRKMIMEVIFGSEQTSLGVHKSQLRSRNNCAKNLDKDFVYDMTLVDTQIRKQAAMENKVKPIKIIKNNESDFKVINVSTSQQKKKK